MCRPGSFKSEIDYYKYYVMLDHLSVADKRTLRRGRGPSAERTLCEVDIASALCDIDF